MHLCDYLCAVACENAISVAVTEIRQAEMRLKSAQAELKEKEKASKNSGQAYAKDKAAYDAIQKEISRIEVLLTNAVNSEYTSMTYSYISTHFYST